MLQLSQSQLAMAEEYISKNCRPLDQARFSFLFRDGDPTNVLSELKKFQNLDGGFGNGLEPDFTLPDSSPMATTIAFQILDELQKPDKAMARKAITYLENTFIKDRPGWLCVPEKVNTYPHAPWWNWGNGQTVIDTTWGNPTAEILGYLTKYGTTLDLKKLTNYTIAYWENITEFSSEHEVFCFIRLYNHLPKNLAEKLEKSLLKATQKLVALDPEKWKTYNPQPVQFEPFCTAGIEENLDFIVSTVTENGIWEPNWIWGQYDDVWKIQKIKWEGVITLQNLKYLQAHDRIEK